MQLANLRRHEANLSVGNRRSTGFVTGSVTHNLLLSFSIMMGRSSTRATVSNRRMKKWLHSWLALSRWVPGSRWQQAGEHPFVGTYGRICPRPSGRGCSLAITWSRDSDP